MELELHGHVAIVTGGGNGIGAATSIALAQEGARIVVADIDHEAAKNVAAQINQGGSMAAACEVDVTHAGDVQRLLEFALQSFGGIQILVNNAGFTRDMRVTAMGEEDWDAVVDVVLKGAFLCTKAAVPHFKEQRYGRIINISSRAHLGNPGQGNYSAAKAGLIGFTKAMSLELGRDHVTVNAIAPGLIDTEALRRLPHYEKVKASALRTTPIPRLGEVRDVADAITFLASKRAGYVSGDVLHVTGGRY